MKKGMGDLQIEEKMPTIKFTQAHEKGRGDLQIEGKISTIKLTQAHEKGRCHLQIWSWHRRDNFITECNEVPESHEDQNYHRETFSGEVIIFDLE